MLQATRIPEQTSPPEHAVGLQDIVLADERGEVVRLGDLWSDQPAVLIFLRHYACVFCRAHAVQLHRARKRFEKAGSRMVAIGQGTPEQAARFKEDQGVEIPLLVDPERVSYRAAGAKIATMYELLGPRVIARAVAWTIASRWRLGSIAVHQGRPVDHPAQLGGVLVIARDGSIRYAHMSEDASDNPPVGEVLAAVRAIRPHAEAS